MDDHKIYNVVKGTCSALALYAANRRIDARRGNTAALVDEAEAIETSLAEIAELAKQERYEDPEWCDEVRRKCVSALRAAGDDRSADLIEAAHA